MEALTAWWGAGLLLLALLHACYLAFWARRAPAPAPGPGPAPRRAPAEQKEEPAESAEPSESRPSSKPTKKRAAWKGKSEYTHPWLLKSLKGHGGAVLNVDFSSNGKFLASACEDGSVMIWDIKDLTQKEHKTLRVNIEYDYANFVAWSPDTKAFVVHKVRESCIQVYRVEKKKDGMITSATAAPNFQTVHDNNVIGFGIACNGKFMMSCSSKTDLVIWDIKGHQLEKMDTYLMTTYTAKISPCGRFVLATGFTPDVKVMEVVFDKSGEYKQVKKAYELSGHSSGVYDVAFDTDTSHIATISKDGTWKLYHTNINYNLGESVHCLTTGRYTQCAKPPRIALSPNAEVLAVSVDCSLELYDTEDGKLYDTISDIFLGGPITCVKFDASGKYVFVSGDRAIRVFHNVCGYYTTANTCGRLLKTKQTSATKERLAGTIEECRETLAKFGKSL